MKQHRSGWAALVLIIVLPCLWGVGNRSLGQTIMETKPAGDVSQYESVQEINQALQQEGLCAWCRANLAKAYFDKTKDGTRGTRGAADEGAADPGVIAQTLAQAYIEQGKYQEAQNVAKDVGAKDWLKSDDYQHYFGDNGVLTNEISKGLEKQEKYYGEGGPVQTAKTKLEKALSDMETAKTDMQTAQDKLKEVETAKEEMEKAEKTLNEAKSAVEAAGDNATEEQKAAVEEAQKAFDEAKKKYDDLKKDAEQKVKDAEKKYEDTMKAINETADKFVQDGASFKDFFTNAAKDNEILGDVFDKVQAAVKDASSVYKDMSSSGKDLLTGGKDGSGAYTPSKGASQGVSDLALRAFSRRASEAPSQHLNGGKEWADRLGWAGVGEEGKPGGCTCKGWNRSAPTRSADTGNLDTAQSTPEPEKKGDRPRDYSDTLKEWGKKAGDQIKKLGGTPPEPGTEAARDLANRLRGRDATDEEVRQAAEDLCPEALVPGAKTRQEAKQSLIEERLKKNGLPTDHLPAADSYFWSQAWQCRNNPDALKTLVERNTREEPSTADKPSNEWRKPEEVKEGVKKIKEYGVESGLNLDE